MRSLLLVIVLAIGAGVAHADNGLFYLGAGVTSNNVNSVGVPGIDNNFPKISSTSWKVFAGIRPIRLFAVEVDYLDLGSSTNTVQTPLSCADIDSCTVNWDSGAKAFAGYALGFLPIPLPYLDVYGKAGIARYKLNRSITDYNSGGVPIDSRAFPDNSTVFTWGAGVQAHIGIIGARLEYEGFDTASTSVFSLSVFLNLM
jgi:opacity protein-like surface antigen